jgi:hypothetical protein
MHIFIIISLLYAPIVFAKKFALVIGGSSRDENGLIPKNEYEAHEFGHMTARQAHGLQRQGFEVTTLFGISGMPEGALPQQLQEYKKSQETLYGKLESMGAKAATKENILASLRQIRDSARPGDEFSFNLSAHGYRECDGSDDDSVSTSPDRVDNNVAGCRHVIAITGTDGAFTKIPTSELADILREIDQKGVKANVNFISCHSGAAQNLFGGMPNTCVSLPASANNYNWGCFPSDAPDDISYTSVSDMIQTSHFIDSADEMMQDEFFKSDPCLEKLTRHYRQNNLAGTSQYDLFMNARRHDITGNEPSLSSHYGFSYFTSGKLSAIGLNYGLATAARDMVCETVLDTRIDDFISNFSSVLRTGIDNELSLSRSGLKTSIETYNDLIRQQIALVQDLRRNNGSPNDPRLLALIARVKESAESVMRAERKLVDLFDQNIIRPQLPAEDQCLRQRS